MGKQTVTVSVLAETKKFSSAMRNLSKETGLSKLASGAKSVASFGAKAVGTVVGLASAVGALALKGGFTRALNIEDAKASLTGLGHSIESIDKIMDSALASVKGTSFGLGDAATIASTAVAAGIAPGEKLTRTLKLTANSAALARVGLSEMGSILNKVWTAGKVSTQELNQLADRGIPIWTKLAEHYNVSATELRKMVSQGKVDAESFAEVLEGTVGNAAEAMGNTTRGAWANMLAALSRAGESFLSSVFPMFKEGLTGITGYVDQLGPAASAAGAALGVWVSGTVLPALSRLGDWLKAEGLPRVKSFAQWITGTLVPALRDFAAWAWDNIKPKLTSLASFILNGVIPRLADLGNWLVKDGIPKLKEFGEWVNKNSEWLGPLAVAIGGLVGAVKAYTIGLAAWKAVTIAATAAQTALSAVMATNSFVLIAMAVAALVAGLTYFFTKTEAGQKIVKVAWKAIQTAVKGVVDWFNNTVKPIIVAVWETISSAAQSVANWYQQNVAPVFQAFGELLSAVFGLISSGATTLWNNVLAPIFGLIRDGWNVLWTGVQVIWEKIGPPIMSAISTTINNVKTIWSGVWNAIKTIFTGVWNAIKIAVETALGVIKGIINTVTAVIKGDWNGAWNAIKNTISTVWNGIRDGVQNGINTVMNLVGGIKDTVLQVLANAGSWLLDTGKNLIVGLWNGINDKITWVKDKITGLGSTITNAVKGIFGIHSPSRVFRAIGDNLMAGLALGIQNLTKVKAAINKATIGVENGFDPKLTATLAPSNANHGGAGISYQITVQTGVGDPVAIGREVSAALDAFERQNGGRRVR